jgi:hypothetical protein
MKQEFMMPDLSIKGGGPLSFLNFGGGSSCSTSFAAGVLMSHFLISQTCKWLETF